MLKVSNLTGGYGSGVILHDVSLELNRGETVCVVGPNGAGKTTLLRAIYGRIAIRSGKVTLDGEDLLALPGYQVARHGVAHVPEGRGLFPNMTVMENLEVGALLTPKGSARQRRLELTLELFPSLKSRPQQTVATMSGGEQQMVAIGRALMSSPRLLLLDEPSLGLAPRLIDEIFECLQKLREAEPELAILMVEQRVLEGLQFSHRGYVLEAGEVVLSGNAKELIGNPQLQAAFLGEELSNESESPV